MTMDKIRAFLENEISDKIPLEQYARFEVIRRLGNASNNPVHEVFEGSLQDQIDRVLEYICDKALWQKIIKYDDRIQSDRIWTYSLRAITDAVVGVSCFQDFQARIARITIQLYDEEIRITRYPCRQLHDSAIDVSEECDGLSVQVFVDSKDGSLTIAIPIHPAFKNKPTKMEVKNRLYREKILAIAEEPISLSELAAEMGYKCLPAKLKHAVKELTEQGRLSRTVGSRSQVILQTIKAFEIPADRLRDLHACFS